MKRLILKSPTGLTIEQLSSEQQSAIRSVFSQFVLPMPGTIPFGTDITTIEVPNVDPLLPAEVLTFTGYSIVDAIVADNYDPTSIIALNLPFIVLGEWQWDGDGHLSTITPLDSSFIHYLPAINEYDAEGNVINTSVPTLTLPHNWAGWPTLV